MHIQHRVVDRVAKAKEWYDSQISAGYCWRGAVFQVDAASRAAIASRAFSVARTSAPVEWRTAMNELYPFTAVEFLEFADGVELFADATKKESWRMATS